MPEWLWCSMFCFFQFVIYITNDKCAVARNAKWTMEAMQAASWATMGVIFYLYIDLCNYFLACNIVI
ncbi:MAG: hypothetical protein ACLUPF_12000 [Dorea sp.]